MSQADISFVLLCTCLVFIMTPALAFFYGGLLRKKNIINMMAMCFVSISIVSILWFFIAYSLAFGPDLGGGFIGGLDFIFLAGVGRESYAVYSEDIPHMLFMVFQLMFAIITVAIIASPFSERVNFGAFCIFISIWLIIVYSPIAHWVWGDGGFLKTLGALDFAGGTVVHINVGFAALAVALVIGPREGYLKESMEPSNIPYVLLGTGLLWLGWFGFNGGSALAADNAAGMAMAVTQIAAASAALAWMFAEWVIHGKPSVLGIASGTVAGLVAITPASGTAGPMGAIFIGMVSGIICFLASTKLKRAVGYDDSLDVFGVHATGGIVGALLTGIFADASLGGVGLAAGFNIMTQVFVQFIGVIATLIYSAGISFMLLIVIDKLIGLRVTEEQETIGLDISLHDERGYSL